MMASSMAAAARCLAAVVVLGLSSLAEGSRWAVIAVGSSGFANYRHQADACHAYQLMVTSGIPESQIILMMQDDVAWSAENPFPGQLYNKPGWGSPNVYDGCNVDYRGSIVTADLFLKVITGDDWNLPAGGSGKVLRSTDSDQVFLNFVDHGGVGIVQFPNGPLLHAAELGVALETMQRKHMFKELAFYMEACDSGSMFPNLSRDGKIFAVTAAGAGEPSYAAYCPPSDNVNGRHIGSCLGDLFSVSWMEEADKGAWETVRHQVAVAAARTTRSQVSTFGDESVGWVTMGLAAAANDTQHPAAEESESSWDVHDISLHSAYWQWMRASAKDKAKAETLSSLERIVAHRKADEELFANITLKACDSAHEGCSEEMASYKMALQDGACHKALSLAVHEECPRREERHAGGWNGFSMKFSQVLVNICESRVSLKKEISDLELVVRSECAQERGHDNPRRLSTMLI